MKVAVCTDKQHSFGKNHRICIQKANFSNKVFFQDGEMPDGPLRDGPLPPYPMIYIARYDEDFVKLNLIAISQYAQFTSISL